MPAFHMVLVIIMLLVADKHSLSFLKHLYGSDFYGLDTLVVLFACNKEHAVNFPIGIVRYDVAELFVACWVEEWLEA